MDEEKIDKKAPGVGLVIIAVFVTAVIVGGGVYWWQQSADDVSSVNTANQSANNVNSSEIAEILDVEFVTLDILRLFGSYYLHLTSGYFPNSCHSIRTEIEYEDKLVRIKLLDIVKAAGYCSAFLSPAEAGIEFNDLENGSYTLQIVKGDIADNYVMTISKGHVSKIEQSKRNQISTVKGWREMPDIFL